MATQPMDAALADTVSALLPASESPNRAPAVVASGGERFQTLGKIGEGGMGRVLSARDIQFGRTVAVKELPGERASSEAHRRFAIEALVTGNLEHPGIPAVYERGVRDGVHFYAMRRVQGRTLAEALAKASSFADRMRLLPAVERIAHTVGFAHARGVVHRDIKPENVIVGEHGEVFLLDWGVAKVRDLPEGSDEAPVLAAKPGETAAGSVLGTPSYMAPEQAKGQVHAIDERTDVFALGALLYHVLSGRPPYQGETTMAVVAQAAQGAAPALQDVARDAPASLRGVVEKAMALRPDDRYQSAEQLAAALGGALVEAVTARESWAFRSLIGAVGFGALLFMLIGSFVVWRLLPPLSDQGIIAYAFVALTVGGCISSLFEWRTRGRYQLSPVALALAVCTVLLGLAATTLGAGQALEGIDSFAGAGGRRAAEAARIALAPLSSSAALASLQFVLWGLVRHSVQRKAVA